MKIKFGVAVASICAIVVLSCAIPAVAQTSVQISNSYIEAKLGVGGTVNAFTDSAGNGIPENVSGRFAVEAVGSNAYGLIWYGWNMPCGPFGYWTLKVNDQVYTVGESMGAWVKPSGVSGVPKAFTNPPTGLGRTGPFIDGVWSITNTSKTSPNISVDIRESLVRGQVRFELNLKNNGTTAQTVGLQMTGVVQVGASMSVGFPFLPGLGMVESTTGTFPRYGQLLSGKAIPSRFEVFDNVQSPVTVARCTLAEQDCTAPDYVAIGDFQDIASYTMWLPGGYIPDPLTPVTDESWALNWAQKALAAGATRKIVTYYGLGAADSSWTTNGTAGVQQDTVCLAVEGDRSLKYDSTNSTSGAGDLLPSPFTISAYVYNLDMDLGPYDLQDCTATLFLPPGLNLAAGSTNTAQQQIGTVAQNSEGNAATWEVVPDGTYCGWLTYSVVAKADNGWQQVVSRSVMVPATTTSIFNSGWQLMSVPFAFNNFAIDHAMNLQLGTFGAQNWNATLGQYQPVSQLQPGVGFWMIVGGISSGQTQTFPLAADASIVGAQFGKQVLAQYINISAGWNMIGNPFVYPVYWGQIEVFYQGQTYTLDQAVANGWLSKTIFDYNPSRGAYDVFSDDSSLLVPWKGYWVRAKVPLTLVVQPAIFPASDVTAGG